MRISMEMEDLRNKSNDLGAQIRQEIVKNYCSHDDRPWIVTFSGGKDSTLVTQLVFEALLEVPPSRRSRPVHVLSSDTQVETPYIVEFVRKSLDLMMDAATSLGLPISTRLVVPEVNDTYWVRVVGYGYPPPSRFMRWCTDRLKIKPANKFVLDTISRHGEVLLLLGARYEESQDRARSMRRHEGSGGFHKHSTLPRAFVWSPIRHLTTDQVWSYLVFNSSPWGGDNIELRDLYKNANAGECTLVIDETTEPCGNSRFGCYTCTVVDRDKSLEGFVMGGKDQYQDLLDLRNWLVEIRDNHDYREAFRRNGEPGIGPLKMKVRKDLLARILDVQDRLGEELISGAEVSAIRQAWLTETMDNVTLENSA
jgi:DNA sulfur modification protein DndC